MDKRKKRLEDTGIYADTSELMKVVYAVIFSFPKKDRVIMGDYLMRSVTDMLSSFSMSYRLQRERMEYIDKFLAVFETFKGLVRVARELKILNAKTHAAILILVQRIDEGITKWRNSASAVQTSRASNDGPESRNQEHTRGGDAIMNGSSGSAPV